MSGRLEQHVAGIAALNDPVRRRLYRFVAESDEPVGRDQAAAAVGVKRSLAAFHLDKLVDEQLLDVEYRRLTGRTGPGAGRPAKLYRRSDHEIQVSIPPREYDLAGLLLAAAIDESGPAGARVREHLEQVATRFGERIAEATLAAAGPHPSPATQRGALVGVLAENGFEPRQVGDDIVLANCPFHALAQRHTDLVCSMNLRLLEGVCAALPLLADELQPRLEPEDGQCCVKFCHTA